MELQMQELLDQIKKNGVEAAEAEAAAILESARAEAERLVADAQREADTLLANAKKDTERLVRVSEDALRQAGRNLLLSFRESVNRELATLVAGCAQDAYTPDALADMILRVVEAWAKNTDAHDLSVLIGEGDMDALEGALLTALRDRLASGVTLKPSEAFHGGFRIAVNSEGVYYDYSAAAVAEMLSAYLNPRVTALLKEAAEQ